MKPSMLSVRALQVAIGPIEILRGVSLDIGEGEMIGLVGRNGAGGRPRRCGR